YAPDAVVRERDAIKNALDQPHFAGRDQLGIAGQLPAIALVVAAEHSLFLAETPRRIDDALPGGAAGQSEAHRRAADVEALVVVVLLGIVPAAVAQIEAAAVAQIAVGHGIGRWLGTVARSIARRPVVEVFRELVLHMDGSAAFVHAPAVDHPRVLGAGVGLALVAVRAGDALHVLALDHALVVRPGESGEDVGTQLRVHAVARYSSTKTKAHHSANVASVASACRHARRNGRRRRRPAASPWRSSRQAARRFWRRQPCACSSCRSIMVISSVRWTRRGLGARRPA